MALIIKSCPKCHTTLDVSNYVLRPGVVETITCQKCGTHVLLSSDPSFKDASAPRKVFYGLALVKTIILIGVPAVICVAAIGNGQYGIAAFFGVLTVALGFIFTK